MTFQQPAARQIEFAEPSNILTLHHRNGVTLTATPYPLIINLNTLHGTFGPGRHPMQPPYQRSGGATAFVLTITRTALSTLPDIDAASVTQISQAILVGEATINSHEVREFFTTSMLNYIQDLSDENTSVRDLKDLIATVTAFQVGAFGPIRPELPGAVKLFDPAQFADQHGTYRDAFRAKPIWGHQLLDPNVQQLLVDNEIETVGSLADTKTLDWIPEHQRSWIIPSLLTLLQRSGLYEGSNFKIALPAHRRLNWTPGLALTDLELRVSIVSAIDGLGIANADMLAQLKDKELLISHPAIGQAGFMEICAALHRVGMDANTIYDIRPSANDEQPAVPTEPHDSGNRTEASGGQPD